MHKTVLRALCYNRAVDAEIVAIGTELLLGFVVNSDTAFLGRTLAECGINCFRHVTVGDNPGRLRQALEEALERSDLVITCGGLGPTVDDITLETTAEVTGRPLLLDREILRQIKHRFALRGIRMPKSNLRQAMIPQGAVAFPNSVGTAPGFLLRVPGLRPGTLSKILVALPGPPAELIPMVRRWLIPRLKRYAGGWVILSKTLKLTGITESEVDAKIRDLLAMEGATTLGIYAHPAQVDLRITAKASGRAAAGRQIVQVEGRLRRRLGKLIFGADEETLEKVVGKLLKHKRLTLGVAESCTGGLIGHRITEVPGSSDYFRGGVVAYANELKASSLGVSPHLLARYGAVSAQVAKAMAQGVRRLTGAKVGLSVTGIAGPTGGSRAKPVGLVFIALSTPRGTQSHRCLFSGNRSTVKFKASQTALNLVRLHLL